jgi:outer membrane protein assembly factor BamD
MRNFLVLFLSISIISCSDFYKASKSQDWLLKYKTAVKFYEKKDYGKALLLFEEAMPLMSGKPEDESARFFYAYCQFHAGMYLLSAEYFKRFHRIYNRSKNAEEALFMYGFSLFMETPQHNLDQSSTIDAVEAFQDFINTYPNSSRVAEASKIIAELRAKMELKTFEMAKQYQKVRMYKAALVAFSNFERDYPDSQLREEALFLKLKSQYELSKNSVEEQKKKRFEETLKIYTELVDKYPNTRFKPEATRMFESSSRIIRNLRPIQN